MDKFHVQCVINAEFNVLACHDITNVQKNKHDLEPPKNLTFPYIFDKI